MFNFEFSAEDYRDLTARIIAAAQTMMHDKWWLSEAEQPGRATIIKRRVVRDLVTSVLLPPQPLRAFYREVMRRKHDDHVASHSNQINQFLHLMSSATFIYCYWLIFSDIVTAMWLGLSALFVHQFGHALVEPPCHDKEQLLLGFDTRSKTKVVGIYLLIPLVNCLAAPALNSATFPGIAAAVARQWFVFTALVVFGHTLRLIPKHGFKNAMVWFIKLITDPITDIKAYYPTLLRLRPSAS